MPTVVVDVQVHVTVILLEGSMEECEDSLHHSPPGS